MKRAVALTVSMWAGILSGVAAGGGSSSETTLAQIQGCPDAYTKVPVDIDLLYAGASDVFNPFYTEFEPSHFMNFHAWGSTAAFWTRDGYTRPHYFFYVSRRTPDLLRRFSALKPMTWIQVRCMVRNTFSDQPWIEVQEILETGETVTAADFAHMVRGYVHAERGEFEQAMVELDAVSIKSMPDALAARYLTEVGRAALGAGQMERAISALRQARSLDSTYNEASHWFAQAQDFSKLREQGEVAVNPVLRHYLEHSARQQPEETPQQPEETAPAVTEEWPAPSNPQPTWPSPQPAPAETVEPPAPAPQQAPTSTPAPTSTEKVPPQPKAPAQGEPWPPSETWTTPEQKVEPSAWPTSDGKPATKQGTSEPTKEAGKDSTWPEKQTEKSGSGEAPQSDGAPSPWVPKSSEGKVEPSQPAPEQPAPEGTGESTPANPATEAPKSEPQSEQPKSDDPGVVEPPKTSDTKPAKEDQAGEGEDS